MYLKEEIIRMKIVAEIALMLQPKLHRPLWTHIKVLISEKLLKPHTHFWFLVLTLPVKIYHAD